MSDFENNRTFMKNGFGYPERELVSDQEKGLPQPPVEKVIGSGLKIIDLPPVDKNIIIQGDLFACINNRRSRRKFVNQALTLGELSFLLWATQGVQKVVPAYNRTGIGTLRPVPSAGGRNAYETYLAVNNVTGLESGIYLYRPLEHKLAFYCEIEKLSDKLVAAYGGTEFLNEAKWLADTPVVFIWSCIPYRGEWRYHCESHRLMLLDAGHICQNLYLACEGIGCGTCAIGAWEKDAFDKLLGLDGKDEFVVYLAGVGKTTIEPA